MQLLLAPNNYYSTITTEYVPLLNETRRRTNVSWLLWRHARTWMGGLARIELSFRVVFCQQANGKEATSATTTPRQLQLLPRILHWTATGHLDVRDCWTGPTPHLDILDDNLRKRSHSNVTTTQHPNIDIATPYSRRILHTSIS